MNTLKLEKLSADDMLNIKGGEKVWVWIDGQWVLIETFDIGDESSSSLPPSPSI